MSFEGSAGALSRSLVTTPSRQAGNFLSRGEALVSRWSVQPDVQQPNGSSALILGDPALGGRQGWGAAQTRPWGAFPQSQDSEPGEGRALEDRAPFTPEAAGDRPGLGTSCGKVGSSQTLMTFTGSTWEATLGGRG